MQTLSPQKVNQNGAELTYNPAKILKGTNAGDPTLRPDFKSLKLTEAAVVPTIKPELLNLIVYIGQDQAQGIIIGKLNALANNCFANAVKEETGELDLEKWSKLIQGITVAGETIGDLEDRATELAEEFMKLTMEATDLASVMPKLQELSKQRKDVAEALAERKEEAARRAAQRKATQEANEAKKAAEAAAKAGAAGTPAPVSA